VVISIVIPAHNEAAVITRALTAVLAGAGGHQVEVVVACNGCTDGTADVVRATGLPVRTIEVSEASKIAALRAADAVATGFPRIYLDADVVLTGAAAVRLAEELRAGPALAGRPPLRYDTGSASFLVRRYYAARSRLPEVLGSLWGAGVYALTADGHARVTPWPDVLADDLYVDRSFRRDEITVMAADPVVVRVPRTAGVLLRVLERNYRGRQDEPPVVGAVTSTASSSTTGRTAGGVLRLVVRRPYQGLDVAVYLGFAVLARWRLRRNRSGSEIWGRDESSREPVRPV
jgi:glycosyltransferase involved in cell wall biosynthesis